MDKSVAVPPRNYESITLARWKMKPDGNKWLEDLIKTKKNRTRKLQDYGDWLYYRYKVLMSDISHIVENGPPDMENYIMLDKTPEHVIAEKWINDIVFYKDRIAACPKGKKLWVDVITQYDDIYIDILDEILGKSLHVSDEECDEYILARTIYQEIIIVLSDEDDPPPGRLASWITGDYEFKWLNDLVVSGKVLKHSTGGFPDTYTGLAQDILPLIKNGPPIIIHNNLRWKDWTEDTIFYHDRIASCPPDLMLTVEIWDLD